MKTVILSALCLSCTALQAQLQNPPTRGVELVRQEPNYTQRLVPTGADGKIELLDGFVELKAIKESPLLDEAAREKAKPLALDWLLDVQQQVIDNLDFVNEIEPFDGKPGYFETLDPQNPKSFERINSFSKQLNSPGQLINLLMYRRVLKTEAERAIRQMVFEYDMVATRQSSDQGKDALAAARHQYRSAYRDAMGMFHSLLDRAAANIDEAVAAARLSEQQAAALAPAIAQVKAARGKPEVRTAVKGVLKDLSLVQRRALFLKVRDLAPLRDAFSMI